MMRQAAPMQPHQRISAVCAGRRGATGADVRNERLGLDVASAAAHMRR